jgi:predicted RNase H-like nuclease
MKFIGVDPGWHGKPGSLARLVRAGGSITGRPAPMWRTRRGLNFPF